MGCTGVDANVLYHWHSVVRTLTISPKTLIGGISVVLVSWGGSTLIVRGISSDEPAALLLKLSLSIPTYPITATANVNANATLAAPTTQNVVTLGPAVQAVPLFPCPFMELTISRDMGIRTWKPREILLGEEK